MLFYITSNNYKQIISNTVKESEEVVVGNECSNEFIFLKYIKENIKNFTKVDILILDISSLKDAENEIIEAIETLRIMAAEMRIIILATNRYEGDEFLKKCFEMSVYNIINTSDYLKIREELLHSILSGNQYKDALRFKESISENNFTVKNGMKDADRIRIGFVGSEKRIGVTHNSIVLANYFRKKGFLVAIVENNNSKDFTKIMEAFGEKKGENGYFTVNSIDYYENSESVNLQKPYNFIIEDYGEFEFCNKLSFEKTDIKIVITGAKPWEIDNVNYIFGNSDHENLKEYYFYFNFVESSNRDDVKSGMGELEKVYFLKYVEDPFTSDYFSDADIIFKDYLPEVIENKKTNMFNTIFKRGKRA